MTPEIRRLIDSWRARASEWMDDGSSQMRGEGATVLELLDELDAALLAASPVLPEDVRPECDNSGHCPCDISTRHEWFVAFCEEREKNAQAVPLLHDWTPREGQRGVYDCPRCGMWTANKPLYKNDPCEGRETGLNTPVFDQRLHDELTQQRAQVAASPVLRGEETKEDTRVAPSVVAQEHGDLPRKSQPDSSQRCGVCGFIGSRDVYTPHDCYWMLRGKGAPR